MKSLRLILLGILLTLIIGPISSQSNMSVSEMYEKAEALKDANKFTEAVEMFRQAADRGSLQAMNQLGLLYMDGKGVSQSSSEAVKWVKKAAEQGLSSAQYNLGIFYRSGRAGVTDYSEALKWYSMAGEKEQATAEGHLGFM